MYRVEGESVIPPPKTWLPKNKISTKDAGKPLKRPSERRAKESYQNPLQNMQKSPMTNAL